MTYQELLEELQTLSRNDLAKRVKMENGSVFLGLGYCFDPSEEQKKQGLTDGYPVLVLDHS